jgi:predicted Zn finger-like uncharacterized protein
MSLATRCTHCGTIFKVVEDQLKVSEGWVRCGRCQEVFHALPTLFDLDKDAPPPREGHSADAAQAFATPDNPASQLPSEWPPTQPQSQPGELDAAHAPRANPQPAAPVPGPRLGPQPAPPQTRSWLAPVPATTEFDLDTSVQQARGRADSAAGDGQQATAAEAFITPLTPTTPGLDDIELDTAVPLTRKAAPLPDHGAPQAASPLSEPLSLRLSPMGDHPDQPQDDEGDDSEPVDWASPSRIDRVPSTEESDALDSRYLLPSTRRDRPAARRPADRPDFADAEFPNDWLLEAEEDEEREAAQAQAAREAGHAAALAGARALPQATPAATPPAHEPAARDDPRVPTTVPSQFLDELEGLSAPHPATAGEPLLESEQADTGSPGKGKRRSKKTKPTTEAAPGFLKQAQSQARWRHPAVRALLSLTLVALLATLGLQVVHQFRDLIAAHDPSLRPYLAQWCLQMGCELKPPLRIEDLQVDSLSFVRATSEGPDAYRLTVVLHNKAPVNLAWPDIDLSLTDVNGALLIRRVFSPQDATWQDSAEPQVTAGQHTPEAAPAQRSTTLQWRLKIAQLQPAGYTADIFYP